MRRFKFRSGYGGGGGGEALEGQVNFILAEVKATGKGF